jgi:hypothetical protein
LQDTAPAATQQPGVVISSVAAAGAAVGAGEAAGFAPGQLRNQQEQESPDVRVGGAYGVQEGSRLMAQLKV